MPHKLFTIVSLLILSIGSLLTQGLPSEYLLSKPYENSSFITIDRLLLHYRLLEPADEPKGNIVFIHGFAASTFSWRKNMDFFLKKGYRVLAVDMPGYGFSEKERAFSHSHEERANLLWKLLDSVAGQKWIIVGHSMGGGTAGYMASMHPDRTEKLVLANSVFGRMNRTLGRTLGGYLLRFPVFFHLVEGMGKAVFINYERFEPLLSSAYGQDADSLAVKGYLMPFTLEGSSVAVFETFLRGFDTTQPDLEKISMPTILIWGKYDTWVPVELGQRLHSQLGNSKLEIIPDAGHNPMETHPDEFNEMLLKFLLNSNSVEKL